MLMLPLEIEIVRNYERNLDLTNRQISKNAKWRGPGTSMDKNNYSLLQIQIRDFQILCRRWLISSFSKFKLAILLVMKFKTLCTVPWINRRTVNGFYRLGLYAHLVDRYQQGFG